MGGCICGCSGEEGKRKVSCCDNLHYGLPSFFNPVCPGIIISLNAFDVALMFFLHFVFKLMSLQHLAELPCKG